MSGTRTWLTTPVGSAPVGDEGDAEHWVPGPAVPSEPRPPWPYRGAAVLLAVLLLTVGLTFVVAPTLVEPQDPTFAGDDPSRLDGTGDDLVFERPNAN